MHEYTKLRSFLNYFISHVKNTFSTKKSKSVCLRFNLFKKNVLKENFVHYVQENFLKPRGQGSNLTPTVGDFTVIFLVFCASIDVGRYFFGLTFLKNGRSSSFSQKQRNINPFCQWYGVVLQHLRPKRLVHQTFT